MSEELKHRLTRIRKEGRDLIEIQEKEIAKVERLMAAHEAEGDMNPRLRKMLDGMRTIVDESKNILAEQGE